MTVNWNICLIVLHLLLSFQLHVRSHCIFSNFLITLVLSIWVSIFYPACFLPNAPWDYWICLACYEAQSSVLFFSVLNFLPWPFKMKVFLKNIFLQNSFWRGSEEKKCRAHEESIKMVKNKKNSLWEFQCFSVSPRHSRMIVYYLHLKALGFGMSIILCLRILLILANMLLVISFFIFMPRN